MRLYILMREFVLDHAEIIVGVLLTTVVGFLMGTMIGLYLGEAL